MRSRSCAAQVVLPAFCVGRTRSRTAPRGAAGWQTGPVTGSPAGAADEIPVCSARGCRAPAVWALRWNNPTLHDPDRRKTWLACDTHHGHLTEFLARRGFLREVEPLPAGPVPG